MVVALDITTMQGEAQGMPLPDAQSAYRFLTMCLNEGKRCSLVVRVPSDCSAEVIVNSMNEAWAIIALCTKAKWQIAYQAG